MIVFVEGSMERQFIDANFAYARSISISNGISWTVEQLVNQIVTRYAALNYEDDIVVWIDRERRTETMHEIRDAIKLGLCNAGAKPEKVHILVNDLMSENIILSDESVIQAEFNEENYQYTHEGRGGKAIIKEKFNKIGVNYKETIHGVRLLKKIRLANCAKNSPSVDAFLSTFTRECWWISPR